MTQTKAVLKRFLKGFIAGGLAQIALIISAGVTFHNLAEAKALVTVLIAGFISGGLLAVEKMLFWTDAPQQ
jgi:hypothetical protein